MNGSWRTVLVTQRVVVDAATGERRDALDQRWPRFLHVAGLVAVAVPNISEFMAQLVAVHSPCGVLLTGGNDLESLGGDAPERDAAENALIAVARSQRLPLLGVCRGMQLIQHNFGIRLHRVEGHVAQRQLIDVQGNRKVVNSFHNFGTCATSNALTACGRADDGVVKMVRAVDEPILGIMWHPERCEPASADDLALFRRHFGVAG